jgi:hypothetical protein
MEEENWKKKEEESVTRDLKRKKKTIIRAAPDNLERNGHLKCNHLPTLYSFSPFYLNIPISST